MRLILCGKSFVACAALAYLKQSVSVDLAAVGTRNDRGEDTWEPSLKKKAMELGVPFFEGHKQVEGDVLISLEYDRIIRVSEYHARCYNLHFSDLPRYRGCHTSVLPIRNGESVAGVTLHEMTDGIDDGPIIDQLLFELPDSWTAYDLYLAYNDKALSLFKRNIHAVLEGDYTATPQDDEQATYFPRSAVDYNHREIVTLQPAREVHNYIRSLIFPPYQLPTFQGREIVRSELEVRLTLKEEEG